MLALDTLVIIVMLGFLATCYLADAVLNCYICAANKNPPEWGFKQIKVTCDNENNPDDPYTYWNVESQWDDHSASHAQRYWLEWISSTTGWGDVLPFAILARRIWASRWCRRTMRSYRTCVHTKWIGHWCSSASGCAAGATSRPHTIWLARQSSGGARPPASFLACSH